MAKFNWESYISFLSKRFGIEVSKITSESRFTDDLGLDSLSLYSLIEDFEEAFDVSFEISDIVDLRTVGNVFTFVSEKVDALAA